MDILRSLGDLAKARCFIVYALRSPSRPGKYPWKLDKVPIDPLTGFNTDAQNPANWMPAHEAMLWATQYGLGAQVGGHGIGIVLHEGLGVFCVDLDDALGADGQWKPHVLAICQRFPGAAQEVSVSGRALHVLGRFTGPVRAHSVNCAPLTMEAYDSLRFIALTGDGWAGSIDTDHTAAYDGLLADYFPPRPASDREADWTDTPVSDWHGPTDDAELVNRALRSHGAAAVFGGRASFVDLWTANGGRLAHFFPSPSGDDFNRSDADIALANHLSFWTGGDCERVERLMLLSELARPKWEREGYLRDTILNACGTQKQWYNDGTGAAAQNPAAPVAPSVAAAPLPATHAPAVPVPDTAIPSAPASPSPAPGAILIPESFSLQARQCPPPGYVATSDDQRLMFDGCIYVEDINQALMPEGVLLDSVRFDNRFPGITYVITNDGTKPSKSAWEAFVQSEVVAFPKVRGLRFSPTSPAGAIIVKDALQFVNSWVPVDNACTPGDYSLFWQHLKKILPNGQDAEILLYYMAALVQYQGTKFSWCPFLQGVEGNGKSIICEALERCIGPRYTHRGNAAKLGSEHNAELYAKIFLRFDEVKIDHQKGSVWETLKNMVTETSLEIRAMYTDKVTREVCFNMILVSNWKNGIRKTRNDRRLCPLFCAQQHLDDLYQQGMVDDPEGVHSKYFDQLWAWADAGGWAIINWLLRSIQIPDDLNPAKGCRRAPTTTSTHEAIMEGFGAAEQELVEAINAGYDGFRDGWVSSVAVDRLLSQIGKDAAVPRRQRRALLLTLGYVPHPGLPEGRSITKLVDGSQPVIYVKPDHAAYGLRVPAEVMQAYLGAQKK